MLKKSAVSFVASVVFSFAMPLLLVSSSFAATPSAATCKEVVEDLKAMQKAQASISESLISNHDTFANLLDDYSSALSTSAAMGMPVTKDAVTKMSESAKSFRERGQNAQKLNKKLTTASDEVISQAIACLKK